MILDSEPCVVPCVEELSASLSIGVGGFFMGVLVVRVEVRTCPLRCFKGA